MAYQGDGIRVRQRKEEIINRKERKERKKSLSLRSLRSLRFKNKPYATSAMPFRPMVFVARPSRSQARGRTRAQAPRSGEQADGPNRLPLCPTAGAKTRGYVPTPVGRDSAIP